MKLQGSQAAKVAYRILQKQSVEGNPTKDSYQYSKTGKRTEVLKETFKKNENRYGVMIDNTVVGQLDNEFHSIKDGII
jgi:glutathione peroxidase-family protein